MSPGIDLTALAEAVRRLYPTGVLAVPVTTATALDEFAVYRDDPVGFVTDVLGVTPTDEQLAILKSLPGRIKLEAGHNVGKSFIMACIALWWFYTRRRCVIICNAPSKRAVEDVLWVEIRLLWARSKRPLPDYFIGPKAPEMFDTHDHWAKGYTTSTGEGYQGRHRENMLFLFDEDEGIDPIYWTTTSTMYQPDGTHCWVASCNPVTNSSQSFLESLQAGPDGKPKWKLFTLSSLNHPNVAAQLAGRPPVVPGAVTLGQVEQWVEDWTDPLPPSEDKREGDFEWPPGSGKWRRPGPIFQSRVQGVRPGSGIDTVWSSHAWELAVRPKFTPEWCWEHLCGLTVGVDCAAYGDDDTAVHLGSGPLSLHHEAHNGWGPDRTAGRIKELLYEWTDWYNRLAREDRKPLDPLDVVVNIEFDGGYGVGVHSHRGEFRRWRGVTMAGKSHKTDHNGRPMFANNRAEAWFNSADRARFSQMDLSRLPQSVLARLRLQLLTIKYEVKPDSSRLVESKDDIKERMGRSPDDADALILYHFPTADYAPTVVSRDD